MVAMSELKEELADIVVERFVNIKLYDKKSIDNAVGAILAAFKAHIERFKEPGNDIVVHTNYGLGHLHGWDAAIEAYRKALMESLE